MRVGIITYALDRPLTGISRYTLELVQAMAKTEQRPELVLLTAGGPGPLTDTGLETVPLRGCRLAPGLMILGQIQLPLVAKRFGLDLIHDTIGMTPFFFTSKSIRTVVTLYDVFPLSYPGVSTKWDTLIYRYWLPKQISHADAILTISSTSSKDIINHLHVNSTKVHNVLSGVNSRYHPANATAISIARKRYNLPENYILYVGSVEERKNLRRVFETYARIRQDIKQKLVIVGSMRWKYSSIMEIYNSLGLESDVLFAGYVEEADLPAIYSGADLFAFPSLYEGFGLPVLEAMACGTPVITSNVSSLPEVAGDAAILVDPYDVDVIASAIWQVLNDSELQTKLRAAGLERAKQFTWEKVAHKTLEVYRHVLG